jgi:hypothetical protein
VDARGSWMCEGGARLRRLAGPSLLLFAGLTVAARPISLSLGGVTSASASGVLAGSSGFEGSAFGVSGASATSSLWKSAVYGRKLRYIG